LSRQAYQLSSPSFAPFRKQVSFDQCASARTHVHTQNADTSKTTCTHDARHTHTTQRTLHVPTNFPVPLPRTSQIASRRCAHIRTRDSIQFLITTQRSPAVSGASRATIFRFLSSCLLDALHDCTPLRNAGVTTHREACCAYSHSLRCVSLLRYLPPDFPRPHTHAHEHCTELTFSAFSPSPHTVRAFLHLRPRKTG
jgi:hypothetical protein